MNLIKTFVDWFHSEYPNKNIYYDFDILIEETRFSSMIYFIGEFINDDNLIQQLSKEALDELSEYAGVDYLFGIPEIDPITDKELSDLGLNRNYLDWTFEQYLKYFDYITDLGCGLEELIGELNNREELYLALYFSKGSPIKEFLYGEFRRQLYINL